MLRQAVAERRSTGSLAKLRETIFLSRVRTIASMTGRSHSAVMRRAARLAETLLDAGSRDAPQ